MPPRTTLEAQLLTIWEAVLGVHGVGARLENDFGQAGTGVLIIVSGAGLSLLGAAGERRFPLTGEVIKVEADRTKPARAGKAG